MQEEMLIFLLLLLLTMLYLLLYKQNYIILINKYLSSEKDILYASRSFSLILIKHDHRSVIILIYTAWVSLP